jgi:hypothetical protein
MTPRPALLVVALAAGALAGSGLGAFAHGPPNDACSQSDSLPEGSSSSGSLELWPLGLRCEYRVAGRVARSEFFGPTAAELYAWIAAAVLLAAAALWRRDLAPVHGAAIAAALLAISGASWQFAGFQVALFLPLVLGPPLAFGLDHLLRQVPARSRSTSLHVAIAISALEFCAVFAALATPLLGIALGLLAGALASARLARSPRARPT